MATIASRSILCTIYHFCGNIHFTHPFFCDMIPHHWITSSRCLEVNLMFPGPCIIIYFNK
jgi:hypothetical protein